MNPANQGPPIGRRVKHFLARHLFPEDEKDQQHGQQIVRQVKLLATIGLAMVVLTVGLVGLTLAKVRGQRRAALVEETALDRISEDLRHKAGESRAQLHGVLDRTVPPDSGRDAVARQTRSLYELSLDHGPSSIRLPAEHFDPLIARLNAGSQRVASWRTAYDAMWQDADQKRTLGKVRALLGKLSTSIDLSEGRRRLDASIRYRQWRAAGGGKASQAVAMLRMHAQEESRGIGAFRNELADCVQLVELLNGEEDLDRLADIRDNRLNPVLTRLHRLIATLESHAAEDSLLTPASVAELKVAILGDDTSSGSGPAHAPAGTWPGGLFQLRHDLLRLRQMREQRKSEIGLLFQDIEKANADLARTTQKRTQALTQEVEAGLLWAWLELTFFSAACVVLFLWLTRRITRGINGQVHAIETRNRDMRLVLDNVNQGLVTLNPDGTMASERSAVMDRWLGPPPPGANFWQHIAAVAPQTAAYFQLGWEALVDNQLLLELMLDQMPKRLVLPDRSLGLSYQPILQGDGESLDKVLLVLSDISAEMAREQAESEQRDLLHGVQKLIANRATFLEFFKESSTQVAQITSEWTGPLPVLKRIIHTLKGNSATFGLASIASLCHEIETRMLETQHGPAAEEQADLKRRWDRFAAVVESIVGQAGRFIEIQPLEHEALIDGILSGAPRMDLVRMANSWKLQPLSGLLLHFADQIHALCQRLGKVPVTVPIDASGLRLSGEHWSGFFSAFSHVVRNAVDHGMEEPAERRDAGKPAQGRIALSAYVSGPEFVLEIADDGRGISWDRLAAKARAAGLPGDSAEDRIALLFADGISSKEEVSEVSGRGVGMGAVREACLRLGGLIQVESEWGRGTTFRFHFPATTLAGPLKNRPPALTTRPPRALSTGAGDRLAAVMGPAPSKEHAALPHTVLGHRP